MNSIKNFLYDISDIVVCLLIVAIIFFAVSFKISDVMAFSPSQEKNDLSTNIIPEETQPETPTDNPDAKPTVTPTTDTSTVVEPVSETVTVTIPSGTPGYGIGKILKEQGLIDDINSFILRVDELGYATRLQSGTFYIDTDMDLDTIIKILTGNQ